MNLSVPPDRLPVCQFGPIRQPPRAALVCSHVYVHVRYGYRSHCSGTHTGRRPDESEMSAVASGADGLFAAEACREVAGRL